ncbi:OmpA family protein [Novispirillum sp. DQ9]|uniref:OmpA family protein n=1 Tax=Novispirillum sp. DQ9 TaxID=3398612 RepID=UPI003C7E7AF2
MRMMGTAGGTARGATGRRVAMTALAMVLALGACSTVEDSWDYVFGDTPPATTAPAEGGATTDGAAPAKAEEVPAAPVPEGLPGDPSPPGYGPGMRRMPTSTRALNDAPAQAERRTVAESASPAAAPLPPVAAAPAPAPASAPAPAVKTAAVAPAPVPPAPVPPAPVQSAPAQPKPVPAASAVPVPPAAAAATVPPAAPVQRADLAPPPVTSTPVPAATPAPQPAMARAAAAPSPVPQASQPPVSQPPVSQAPASPPSVALVPTTPAGEVYANSPRPATPQLAAEPAPRLDIPASSSSAGSAPRLLAPPVSGSGRNDLMIAPPMGGGAGGFDDLGTTVIGGDGRVMSQPTLAAAPAASQAEPFGFDIVTPDMPAAVAAGETLVATIQFEHGSAAISQHERRLLRQVVEMQRQYGGVIQVIGHASSRTADMSMDRHMMVNYTTSARRAESVAAALRSLGAPGDAVMVVAQSDNAPIYREIMPSGEAGNRRAEVYLVN